MYISLKNPSPISNLAKHVFDNKNTIHLNINKHTETINKQAFILVLYWNSCILLMKLRKIKENKGKNYTD